MKRFSFAGIFLVACATSTATDDMLQNDGSMSDSKMSDGRGDSTNDSGIDATDAADDTAMDAVDDAVDSGTMDASDGSICPPCVPPTICCTIKNAPFYGKCYSKLCLACCQ